METAELKKKIPGLPDELYEELLLSGKEASFREGQVILKEGAYVNSIPLVMKGLLKVTRKDEDKEVLLYYIGQGQSCVMSFSACIANSRSKIYAETEEETTLLLLSSEKLKQLVVKYPRFAEYFFSLYHERYEELIRSIDMLAFRRFDERLWNYLQEKKNNTGSGNIRMTHQEIARDLGTLREVVSRTLKKLEKDGKVRLERNEIKIF